MIFNFLLSTLFTLSLPSNYASYSQRFSPGQYSSITLKTFNSSEFPHSQYYNGNGFIWYIGFSDFSITDPINVSFYRTLPTELDDFDIFLSIQYITTWTQGNILSSSITLSKYGSFASSSSLVEDAQSLAFFITANSYYRCRSSSSGNTPFYPTYINFSTDFYKSSSSVDVSSYSFTVPNSVSFDYISVENLDISVTLQDVDSYNIGYRDGYESGYEIGHQGGFIDGQTDGLKTGYNNGYNVGYQEGQKTSTGIYSTSWLSNIFGSLTNFLNLELFPGFRLIYVLTIPVVISLVALILKFFR